MFSALNSYSSSKIFQTSFKAVHCARHKRQLIGFFFLPSFLFHFNTHYVFSKYFSCKSFLAEAEQNPTFHWRKNTYLVRNMTELDKERKKSKLPIYIVWCIVDSKISFATSWRVKLRSSKKKTKVTGPNTRKLLRDTISILPVEEEK